MQWAALDRTLARLDWRTPRAVVACSGGLDSVVLLDLLLDRLGSARLAVAHVDHGVRAGSTADAHFVADLCEREGLEHRVVRLEGVRDDEASLRRARYAALASVREDLDASWVFLGHHRDDQAETVLLRLVGRGRLEGMAPVRGCYVRPLLDVPRAWLERHARRRRLEWREDPSNLEPRYLRNRVRRELLPLMETRYRPGIARRLAALAKLPESPALNPVHEADFCEASDKTFAALRAAFVSPPRVSIGWTRVAHRGEAVPADPAIAWFDADVLDTLGTRYPQPGDRIRPLGMTGRKRLSEALRERGVPLHERDHTVLVVHRDEIVWVPGLIRSSAAPITETTKSRWELTAKFE